MIYAFDGNIPVIHPSAYIHKQATVIGNTVIGENVYVGPHATVRADWGEIIIQDGCNIQESCTIHMFPGVSVLIEYSAHIGHGAIIHGARIGKNCLVGMNSVIMDNVILGDESIVGALTMIRADTHIPNRSLVVGNPHRVIRQVSDEMIAWKTKGTELYQSLPDSCRQSLREVNPLQEIPANRKKSAVDYATWNTSKS